MLRYFGTPLELFLYIGIFLNHNHLKNEVKTLYEKDIIFQAGMEAYQGQGSYEPSADELIDVLKNLENLAAANPALYKAIVDQISGMLKKLLLISDLFYLMCFLFHILPLAVCHDQNQNSAGESSHKSIFCIASLKKYAYN